MKNKQIFQVDITVPCMVPFVLFLMILCAVPPSAAESDFIDFYPTAEARIQSPPELSSLQILCREKKFLVLHITFVGNADGKVVLVAFTHKRVEDLKQVITLEPRFFLPSKESPPVPTARAGPDATVDWAYVYDRNGDGRVDYVAYLFSALPIKPDDFPSDYPKGGITTSLAQYELVIDHTRLFFGHYADDNFDGATDAVVAAVLDPDRYPWVEHFGVLRSTKFNGEVDETWTFKKLITQRAGTVSQKDNKYIVQNAPDTTLQSGKELFDVGTKTMKTINDYVDKCGLTKESFLQK